jgi:hypothetical protein
MKMDHVCLCCACVPGSVREQGNFSQVSGNLSATVSWSKKCKFER